MLTLKPTRGVARTIRLLTVTLELLNLAHPNLVTFTFYLLGTFWQNFRKIYSPIEVAVVVLNETSRKIEQMKIFVLLKNQGNS